MLILLLSFVVFAQEEPAVEGSAAVPVEVPAEVVPADDGFAAWYSKFQALVEANDREAVADQFSFPFQSWEIAALLHHRPESGPVEVDRALLLKHYKRILTRDARSHILGGAPVPREGDDGKVAYYSLGVWGDDHWTGWFNFGRDDDGSWRVVATDGVAL